MLLSGSAGWVRVADQITGGTFVLSASLYVVVLVLLIDLVQLPFAYYQGMTLERRYGLGTQTQVGGGSTGQGGWRRRSVLAVAAALVVWGLMRWMPDYWWAVALPCFSLCSSHWHRWRR